MKLEADGEIRVPQGLLKAAGLGKEVRVCAEPGRLVVTAAGLRHQARCGWADAAWEMNAVGDDRLLDPPRSTSFDEREWGW